MLDNQLGILSHQRQELLVIGSVLSDHLDLVCRNVTRYGLAAFTTLEVVKRPVEALPDDAEFSRLHALDLGDLLKELSSRGLIHGQIYTYVYTRLQENKTSQLPFPESRLTPAALRWVPKDMQVSDKQLLKTDSREPLRIIFSLGRTEVLLVRIITVMT